ncbi:MAG: hypothetical protein ACO1OF_13985 [Adhaeribacter sp.]
MTDLALRLYNDCLLERTIRLKPIQEEKFKYACEKAIQENPGENYFGLKIACRVYLNFILAYPDLDLGPIGHPQ